MCLLFFTGLIYSSLIFDFFLKNQLLNLLLVSLLLCLNLKHACDLLGLFFVLLSLDWVCRLLRKLHIDVVLSGPCDHLIDTSEFRSANIVELIHHSTRALYVLMDDSLLQRLSASKS